MSLPTLHSACTIASSHITVTRSCYRPVLSCRPFQLLVPSCPFLTSYHSCTSLSRFRPHCPVQLPSRTLVYKFLSCLAYCPVPLFPDSIHTALSSYRPVPLFTSYFPVSHCPVPPCPATVLSQPKPSYPELKAT
jgi:hypothetical protein